VAPKSFYRAVPLLAVENGQIEIGTLPWATAAYHFMHGGRVKRSQTVERWVSQSKWRVYLLFFLLMIVPITLFAYSVGQVLRNQNEVQARTESAQIARISATLTEEHFRESITFLQSIASRRTFNQGWRSGNLDLVSWHLKNAKALQPDLSFISVYDLDGKMRAVYPPQPNLVNQNFAHRDWYKGFKRKEQPYVSEVYQSAVAPYQLVVAIAVPVSDDQGKPVGILMGADALDTISQRLVDTQLGDGWTIQLVDQNGQMAARQNIDPHAAAINLSQYEPVKRLRGEESGDGVFGRDGELLFTHYEPVGQFNWGVLVEQPMAIQQQNIRLVQNRVWILSLVFLVVGLVLSTFLGSLYSQLETGNHFMNLSLDMHCTIGFDGVFRSLNPSWERVLGFTTAELLSKPRMAFIHPDDQARTATAFARVQEGESAVAFENRYSCKNGDYKWLLWNAVCVAEKQLIYAVARDITKRKNAEEDLRVSEERYRKLFELNPQPAWIYDRETLRFLDVNRAAEDSYGYSRDEFLAMTICDIRPAEDVAALREALSSLQNDKHAHGTWRHCKRNGAVIQAEITSYSLTFDGRDADFVIAVDVTERKRAQEEREKFTTTLEAANRELGLRNREVERATNMKSKFLASMSHELRTPLNAIVGFSDLLSDETPGPLNPKQKRFVTHIKQGSAHLLQLINDILDLSKIEAGLLELRCEDFQVREALPEVLSTIRPLAMAKNIRVDETLECDPAVYADRIRFKQILYNLLSNAVKFTPKDGRVEVACRKDGNLISISVTDTGVGIRPEDHAMVFEEFRQVQGDTAAAQQGTGLGLAITKRLVEQQGGTIFLESEPGRGSCFSFTLPFGSISQAISSQVEPSGSIGVTVSSNRKPLILIVDDEMAARELMASYLESDYQIAMADSGADAVKKAKELKPDAITLDVLMSGGDGFQALVALKAVSETENIPIIVVSIVDNKQVGFALGAVDYLIKPINKQVMLESLRKHIPNPNDDDSAVLLVDDDRKTLELLQETLRSGGYETQSVQCGARALEVLSSKMVGAVVLDLMMPGMDGFELIRHIRQQSALKNLPVFVMTAKTLSQHELMVLNSETQALIQKNGPWHQQLLAEIGHAIQGKARAKAAQQS
jgi:PAS domain S-box-containing protein